MPNHETCQRTGCRASAEFRPVLVVRVRGENLSAVRAVIGVALCGMCKPRVKVTDVLTDDAWVHIVEALKQAGKAEPTRELTVLDFCRIRSAEGRSVDTRRPC